MAAELVEALRGQLGVEELPAGAAERLAELCATARSEFPELVSDDAALVAVIGKHARGDAVGYLTRCRAGELWLAQRCAANDAAAIAALQRCFGNVIDRVAQRFASTEHSVDDLRQIILSRLLVAEVGRAPKIADYAGQGFFENWLRVTAVRTVLDLAKRKDRARERPADDAAVLAMPDPVDLSLDHLKAEYRPIVADALRKAALALAPGDRVLLRQHLGAGLTIDQLGSVLGVHRATAARRIERAREALLASVRATLTERLALVGDEVDSVIGLVASRLDLSAARLFATGNVA